MARSGRHSGLGAALLCAVATASMAVAANEKAPPTTGFGDFSFTSRKEPIQVVSERLDFDYNRRRTVFRGNVEVTQGDIQLVSDILTVDYAQVGDQNQMREVTADGHVVITQGARKAAGDRAVYDQASRTLVLTGNAVLTEGSNQVNGDTIVVYPDESRMEVKGENRRVKVILFPGQGSIGGIPGSAAKTPKASETAPPHSKTPAAEAEKAADGSP